MASTKTLTFKVTRKNRELISPAEPTPYGFKYLSDIDDQDCLRFRFPLIFFYRENISMKGKDPIKIIRDAVAKALVFYYPFAGRLRECGSRKLVVDCTGEGVVFVEADADVMLQQFGDALHPPFPNLEKLLLDTPDYDGTINCPILFIQVTRLKCGGFILSYSCNHTICDAAGFVQFMSAVGELARGATAPSIQPVWERHLLTARNPPRVSFTHREYDVVPKTNGETDKMVVRYFFFDAADISALRRSLPRYLQTCSKFDIVAACAWRCRTIALSLKPDEEVVFVNTVNIRNKMKPPLPVGYYGNGIVFPAVVTTAKKLSENPFQYAVELVMKGKYEATDDYVRSVADLMVMRDRPSVGAGMNYYIVSDTSTAGFEEVEVGWGKPVYGGVAKGTIDWIGVNWYIPFKNKKGEQGKIVTVCLPLNAMEEFAKQFRMMISAARTLNLSAL
nr:BAHD104 [Lavandula angustifolia]